MPRPSMSPVGTAAFVASLVAKTGDMRITTPSRDARHPRHDRRGRRAAGRAARGGRCRRTEDQALCGRRRPCRPDRGLQPPRRTARHADAGRQRLCYSARARAAAFAPCRFKFRRGGGARPRRAAAVVRVAHDRPPHDHRAVRVRGPNRPDQTTGRRAASNSPSTEITARWPAAGRRLAHPEGHRTSRVRRIKADRRSKPAARPGGPQRGGGGGGRDKRR